jgi:hypothetical protein
MANAIKTAQEWTDALDIELAGTRASVSDQISYAYAKGNAAGVALSYDHPEIDDERGVLVSSDGKWIVYFDPRTRWWTVR